MHTKFNLENLKGTDHLEDLVAVGRIILKLILKKYGLDWIHLAQDRV
jgi:hypothetical protein